MEEVKYQPSKGMSDKEWLEAYPTEMAEMITEKKAELTQNIAQLDAEITEAVKQTIAQPDDINIWLVHGYWVEDWGEKKLDKLKQSLRYFQSLERQLTPDKQGITNSDIDRARDVPLEQVLGLELKRAGAGKLKACCPFHSERTPSFTVYVDQNRWHCYGCNLGGDVIDYVMKHDNKTFREAIETLK